jgi:hypothetical protein
MPVVRQPQAVRSLGANGGGDGLGSHGDPVWPGLPRLVPTLGPVGGPADHGLVGRFVLRFLVQRVAGMSKLCGPGWCWGSRHSSRCGPWYWVQSHGWASSSVRTFAVHISHHQRWPPDAATARDPAPGTRRLGRQVQQVMEGRGLVVARLWLHRAAGTSVWPVETPGKLRLCSLLIGADRRRLARQSVKSERPAQRRTTVTVGVRSRPLSNLITSSYLAHVTPAWA